MDPICLLEGAGIDLGGQPVLDDVHLQLEPGEALGIAGPNGSGKTTLVRSMATLLPLQRGFGQVLGTPFETGSMQEVRRQIGMIGHQPALIPELTLHENLEHVARLGGFETERVRHALEVVGLSGAADRRADACSFGMRRRVEIAHQLISKPKLLLLDEAASGLDSSARELIAALVASTTKRQGGVVVVSHDAAHLRSLCDRVLYLTSGRLEER